MRRGKRRATAAAIAALVALVCHACDQSDERTRQAAQDAEDGASREAAGAGNDEATREAVAEEDRTPREGEGEGSVAAPPDPARAIVEAHAAEIVDCFTRHEEAIRARAAAGEARKTFLVDKSDRAFAAVYRTARAAVENEGKAIECRPAQDAALHKDAVEKGVAPDLLEKALGEFLAAKLPALPEAARGPLAPEAARAKEFDAAIQDWPATPPGTHLRSWLAENREALVNIPGGEKYLSQFKKTLPLLDDATRLVGEKKYVESIEPLGRAFDLLAAVATSAMKAFEKRWKESADLLQLGDPGPEDDSEQAERLGKAERLSQDAQNLQAVAGVAAIEIQYGILGFLGDYLSFGPPALRLAGFEALAARLKTAGLDKLLVTRQAKMALLLAYATEDLPGAREKMAELLTGLGLQPAMVEERLEKLDPAGPADDITALMDLW